MVLYIYYLFYIFYLCIYHLLYSPYLLSMSLAAASAPLNCILRPVPVDTTDTDNEDCASGLTFHISPQICTETVMTTASTGVLMVIDLPTLFKYCTFFLCYPETPLNEHQIKYYIYYSFPLILTARRPKLCL